MSWTQLPKNRSIPKLSSAVAASMVASSSQPRFSNIGESVRIECMLFKIVRWVMAWMVFSSSFELLNIPVEGTSVCTTWATTSSAVGVPG